MSVQQKNATSIMASFATLKSLSDVKKYQSPYQLASDLQVPVADLMSWNQRI